MTSYSVGVLLHCKKINPKEEKEMTLIKYKGNSLFEDIDELGNHFLSPRFWGAGSEMFNPSVDVKQEKDAIKLVAELPGIDPKNVSLDFDKDRNLILEGSKKEHFEKKDEKGYRHVESKCGKFRRVFGLPSDTNIEKAKAKFENGILKVDIPMKMTDQERKKIKIRCETAH